MLGFVSPKCKRSARLQRTWQVLVQHLVSYAYSNNNGASGPRIRQQKSGTYNVSAEMVSYGGHVYELLQELI
jgi:hypothetical protein